MYALWVAYCVQNGSYLRFLPVIRVVLAVVIGIRMTDRTSTQINTICTSGKFVHSVARDYQDFSV